MRIGIITGEYPPMQGGVGDFTRELACEMVRQGHDVHILTRRQATQSDSSIQINAAVGKSWGWHTLNVASEWAKHAKIDVLNIQFQTAAFDMHPAIHLLPRFIQTIPVIVTFHDLRVPYLFPKAGVLREWTVRELARTSAAVIATDRLDAQTLEERWQIRNVCWIPIGSNISAAPSREYDRDDWRSTLGVQPNDLLISYFGFLNESKGALTLIEALACLVSRGVPAHVIMIGGRAGASDATNYIYGKRIDAAIAEAGLTERVHWSGFVGDDEVSAYFYASDLTALPYRDGVSLRRGTLMAALSHGRAIVTTISNSQTPELDGAIATVSPDDPNALADMIESLWQNREKRASLEAAALNASQHFRWDTIIRRTIEFFEQVISQ